MIKYRYVNTKGESIDLCRSPLWVSSFNECRSYEYERIEQNGFFFGYQRRRNVVKPLNVQYYKSDRAEWLRFREEFYKIVNYDVLSGANGRLYDGEWYGVGNFPSEAVTTYDKTRGLWTSTLGFSMPVEVWRRDLPSFVFDGDQDAGTVPAIPLANYPDNYPHGYTSGNLESSIETDTAFPSPFEMVIFGQCTNPSVTIGGHVYNVNVTVPAGSRLIINSMTKKIVVYDAQNVATNVFQYQNHEADKYIFEPIPPGVLEVRYQNIPRIILTVTEERSAAKWS